MQKQEIRQSMLEAAMKAEKTDTEYVTECVREQVCGLEEYKEAQIVIGYVPLKSEVDISAVMDKAAEDGKIIVFPDEKPGLLRLADKNWRKHLIKLKNKTFTVDYSNSGNMVSDMVLNISDTNCNISRYSFTKGIILVPGLAFTEFGTRLGRGAGYYDQLIDLIEKQNFAELVPIGICRKSQLAGELPQQPHDKKVSMVITL